MSQFGFQQWRQAADRVGDLLPVAAVKMAAHLDVVTATGLSHAAATWCPDTDNVRVYTRQPLSETSRAAYTKHAKFAHTFAEADETPDYENEILIKKSGIPYLAPTIDFVQKGLGGPNPLTNTIVGSLLAGGLGYGAGTIAENLFPERYLERGRLRRNMALIGALGGAGLGAMNAYTNARVNMTNDDFYSAPVKNFFRGYLMRNDRDIPIKPYTAPPQGFAPEKQPSIMDSDLKYASFGMSNAQLMQPSIPVAQFNQAVWQDSEMGMRAGFQNHTPPAYAAAATGLMTGLSAGTKSPIIRPMDVINGIASAGVGLATANVAGRALSALAGLTPEGQRKLQDLGLFGGMMHAIVPSVLGFR
jgi:hypothetical protein